jgi:hypothetical protein
MTKEYDGQAIVGIFNNGTNDVEYATCNATLLSSDSKIVENNIVINAGGFYIGVN